MDPRAVDAFRDSLREMGEERARDILRRGNFNPERARLAEQWLAEQDDSRGNRRARKALRSARSAEIAAWIAAVASIVGVVVALAR